MDIDQYPLFLLSKFYFIKKEDIGQYTPTWTIVKLILLLSGWVDIGQYTPTWTIVKLILLLSGWVDIGQYTPTWTIVKLILLLSGWVYIAKYPDIRNTIIYFFS